MFQEGLEIIKNDVGELNLNYFISMTNYGIYLSDKAKKYREGLMCAEKTIFLSYYVIGEDNIRFPQ